MDQGRLNVLTTDHEGGAEGILCGVIKLKNPIFTKGREYDKALPGKFWNFSPLFKTAFGVILHVVITYSVPNAAGNYKINAFSFIISR